MVILILGDICVNESHWRVRIKQGRQYNCRPNMVFRSFAALRMTFRARDDDYFAAFSAAWAAANRAMGTRYGLQLT